MKNKKLVVILGSVLAFILAGLAVVPFFVDAQKLKARIVVELESALQRKVSVQEAEVTLFFGPGVRLKRAAIFDDPRFAAAPFVSLDSLVVKPRIWPLLRGKVEIASVELDQPVIQLIKNIQGVWNFESLGKRTPISARPEPETPSTSKSNALSVAVSLLRFRAGTLSLRKITPSGAFEDSSYQNINLELRNLSEQQTGSFELSLQLPGPEKGSLTASGRLGPFNFAQLHKTRLDGKIEFSNASVAGLSALLFPSATEWAGSLSTDLLVQGTLETGFSADGKIAYTGLGSKDATHESPRVNGELQLKAEYQPSESLTKIEMAELRMPSSTIKLAGSLKSEVDASQLNLKIDSSKLVFDDLLKLASVFGQGPPKGVDASGTGRLALQITGSSKNPAVDGEAQFSDVRLSYPGLSEKIALSPFALTFKDKAMSSNGIQLTVGARTQLQSQLAASFGPDGFVDVQLRSQKAVPVDDLLAIGSSFGFALPEGTSLRNGTIDLQVSARQTLGSKSDLRLDGQANLNGAQVKTAVLKVPMDIRNVHLKLTGNSANISGLSASLPGSNLSGQLQVSNFSAPLMTFALHIDKLDLAKMDQIINSSQGSGSHKSAEVRPSPVPPERRFIHAVLWGLSQNGVVFAADKTTPRASDPLGALDIRDSSLSIDQVIYDQLLLKQVSSKIRMKDKVLELDDLKFQMNQGTHAGRASFDLNGAKPRYTFNSKLQDVDANEFLSQNSSMKDMIYGKFSSDMDVKGEGSGFDEIVKQLKGGGKVRLIKGRITSFNLGEQVALLGKLTGLEFGKAGTEIEDLISNFAINNGRVSTDGMHVRLPGMALRATGSFGLDKTADYQIAAELLSSVSKKYQGSNPLANIATATFFKNENGNVVLPLRMSGMISNPRFALDTKAVQDNLKNSLTKGGVQGTLDTLQNLFKRKQPAQEDSSPQSATPLEEKNAAPLDKPAEKKTNPWEDLLRGVMDKTKDKKKTEPEKQKTEQEKP